MSTIAQVTANGAVPAPVNDTDVKDVWVAYDEANESVSVNPASVDKGTTARFRDPKGGKLRIVFLSPTGKETDTVLDSELCSLIVGGTYHFKCFFTPLGARGETSPKSGGVIDVSPQRP